jgi:hypothetical protein
MTLSVVVCLAAGGCLEATQELEIPAVGTPAAAEPATPAEPAPAEPAEPAPAEPKLVVHEWGTFTSLQGSDGKTQLGMAHEEEALPFFVHGRDTLSTYAKSLEYPAGPVTQKMETPVLYFYAKESMTLDVRVDFPKGIISQWYPQHTWMLPAQVMGLNYLPIEGGAMGWTVQLDPAVDDSAFPWVADDDIWAPSRKVASTALTAQGEAERHVFYRGLGDFDLPIRVTTTADEGLVVENQSETALPAVFQVYVDHDGAGMVKALGALAGKAKLHSTYTTAVEPKAGFQATAKTLLTEALVASGLYADEATAMVDTWTLSYFGQPGPRILYVLPRAWTDELLPLTVEPKPDLVERTLVGRIEVFTWADEQTLATEMASYQAELTCPGSAELGRLAEAKLNRLAELVASGGAKGDLEYIEECRSGNDKW